ncbi:hypothetical protein P4H65_03950 [Paenibacillus chitinolyticus]|uniref:hypothetical protein n=1 Tax=Paenibacillus chitinolyticus TaxID=79263 RepID=UPI002DBD010D|nr:hypothetical protein [Paenibacillus chitinolyticus]MEC0244941.1 hypothetical protein [Paenibacillus chitinolyticus]
MKPNEAITPTGETLIRKVLLTNAVSSGIFGLLLLAFPGYVAEWTGLESRTALVETAVFLLLFVAFLVWTVSRSMVPPSAVLVIAVIDILWVAGSVLLLEDKGTTGMMTVFGISVIFLVAAVVGVFAIFEVLYYWRNRYFRRN